MPAVGSFVGDNVARGSTVRLPLLGPEPTKEIHCPLGEYHGVVSRTLDGMVTVDTEGPRGTAWLPALPPLMLWRLQLAAVGRGDLLPGECKVTLGWLQPSWLPACHSSGLE